MNEEEEEALLEDPCIRWNHFAREKHVVRSQKQCVADANQRAAQRGARNDAQIAADASQWAAQKVTCNDAYIILENIARVNARTFLHLDRQQETHNVDRQTPQDQREQLLKKRRQEIRNVDCQTHSAQRELDRVNQGGNQVTPLVHREFDGNHCGLHHTLGEMTTVCVKCGTLHFLKECAASSSRANV